ncbi:MAG: HlyC/CorC family transporter [Candidatus Eisenbacteria bacterium]|nr:HlyC/CorC family transporter [Candidatus Eisenbacteria bacterium]
MLVFLFCLLAVLLCLSACFSASETALFSLRRPDVCTLEETGDRAGKLIARALDRPGHTLTTILLGNTLVNVAGAAVATAICGILFGPGGVAVAIVADTLLVLILGEIGPKAVAVSFPVQVTRALVGPVSVFSAFVRPVVGAVASFSNRLLFSLGLVGGEEMERKAAASPSELRLLMNDVEEDGSFTKEETRIATNILGFSETRVEQIMTPRVDIVAVWREAGREETAALMRSKKHSKIPVYEKNVDDIVGFLSTKEFFLRPEKTLESLLRPVLFVPSSRRLEGLLQEMEEKRAFVVVVVNEYGETLGLITKEDILEEVVGEIYDEYETDQVPVQRLQDGTLVLDGRVGLDLASEELGVTLKPAGAVTLSGYIFEKLGRLPHKGAQFEEAGYVFEVLGVRRNRVTKCKVRKAGE